MPKGKKGKKVKLVPEKPGNAIRKIEMNGFRLKNKEGADWLYSKVINGEEKLVIISVHPKELGKPFIRNIIRKSRKTKEEWIDL